jgi:hypothetical protein
MEERLIANQKTHEKKRAERLSRPAKERKEAHSKPCWLLGSRSDVRLRLAEIGSPHGRLKCKSSAEMDLAVEAIEDLKFEHAELKGRVEWLEGIHPPKTALPRFGAEIKRVALSLALRSSDAG